MSLFLDRLQEKWFGVHEGNTLADDLRSIDPLLHKPSSLDVDIDIHDNNREGTIANLE